MQACRIAPASGRPEEFLRFTEAFGDKESVVVVRPDAYVGFTGRQHAVPDLARWLGKWFQGEGSPVPAST
jgi:hypothetical protein